MEIINSVEELNKKIKEIQKQKNNNVLNSNNISNITNGLSFLKIVPDIEQNWTILDIVEKRCPPGWESIFGEIYNDIKYISERIDIDEKCGKRIFPAKKDIFRVFELCRPDKIKVVILGQDPYYNVGQGNGISFSSQIDIPPSLANIYKELYSDLGIPPANTGNLTYWVNQGVFLVNTALTVIEKTPESHLEIWRTFSNRILNEISILNPNCIFVFWGTKAKSFMSHINPTCSKMLSSHPSPLSANKGFLGCKHFSQINQLLIAQHKTPIDFDLRNWK